MDPADQELYYQKLDELIYDEDKIVTCKVIALDLDLALEKAKQLITSYLLDRRQVKPDDFGVTYLISGILKASDQICIALVKEGELAEKKDLFKNVAFEQVFSVQKSKEIDFDVLSLVDNMIEENPDRPALPGSVVGKNCVKRKLKEKKLPPAPKPMVKESKSFFAKVEKPAAPKELEQSQKTQPKAKTANGIAGFLSRMPSKSSITTKKEPEKDQKDLVKIKEEKENSQNGNNGQEGTSGDVKMEIDDEIVSVEEQPKENGSSKKRRKTNKSQLPNKRRKRIHVIDDSDSDIFEDEENEEIIQLSEEEKPPMEVEKLPLPPKNKRRKAVDKSYMDEDGYLVTKTEYIFESCSEEEEVVEIRVVEKPKMLFTKKSSTESEPDVKPAKGKKNNNHNKKPVMGKQSSLMSFFKKT